MRGIAKGTLARKKSTPAPWRQEGRDANGPGSLPRGRAPGQSTVLLLKLHLESALDLGHDLFPIFRVIGNDNSSAFLEKEVGLQAILEFLAERALARAILANRELLGVFADLDDQ